MVSSFCKNDETKQIKIEKKSLHNSLGRPKEGVSMEISGWIEPQAKLLLSVSLPLSVHICMHGVRLPTQIPQELEVYLVVIPPLRRQLTDKTPTKSQPQTSRIE